jgi:hypothetical protein
MGRKVRRNDREPVRGSHQGSGQKYRKCRTHDRTRLKTSPKKTLATGEPSTHDGKAVRKIGSCSKQKLRLTVFALAALCTALRLIPPLHLYLTDFQNRTFVGGIAILEQKGGG